MSTSPKTDFDNVSAMMDAIIEYREIVAEIVLYNESTLTALMYRAEAKLPVTLVEHITQRAAFLRKARQRAAT